MRAPKGTHGFEIVVHLLHGLLEDVSRSSQVKPSAAHSTIIPRRARYATYTPRTWGAISLARTSNLIRNRGRNHSMDSIKIDIIPSQCILLAMGGWPDGGADWARAAWCTALGWFGESRIHSKF